MSNHHCRELRNGVCRSVILAELRGRQAKGRSLGVLARRTRVVRRSVYVRHDDESRLHRLRNGGRTAAALRRNGETRSTGCLSMTVLVLMLSSISLRISSPRYYPCSSQGCRPYHYNFLESCQPETFHNCSCA